MMGRMSRRRAVRRMRIDDALGYCVDFMDHEHGCSASDSTMGGDQVATAFRHGQGCCACLAGVGEPRRPLLK